MDNEILHQILNEIKTMKTDLSELKTDFSGLKTDVSGLKTDVSGLKTDVSELKKDMVIVKDTQQVILRRLDAVYDETANLMEFRTEATEKLDNITGKLDIMEDVTKQNLYDIAKIKYAR